MQKDHAFSLTMRLKANFPQTMDELLEEWHDRFLGFDYVVARQCVERYIQRHNELRTSVLLSMLRDATSKAADSRPARLEEEARVDADWAEIDAMFDAMSDEELAEHKRLALAGLSTQSQAMHARRNPRTSRAVKALMIQNPGAAATRRRAHAPHPN